jgi:hypothetical protein
VHSRLLRGLRLGAEARNPSDAADRDCRGHFLCAIAQTAGDFCCRKLCVCEDFLSTKPPVTPAACEPTPENRARCQNL